MKSVLAKIVSIMWVPVLASALYLGWVFWQRHNAQRVPKNPPAANPMAIYGNSVKILQFYTAAREIAPNQKTSICYGVVNATAVRLDPPVEKVWPAVSRCFEIAPDRTTHYTLTAEGPDHTTVSQSIEIAVKGR